MIIYLIGNLAALISLIISVKYLRGKVTMGDLVQFLFLSIFSWFVVVAILGVICFECLYKFRKSKFWDKKIL